MWYDLPQLVRIGVVVFAPALVFLLVIMVGDWLADLERRWAERSKP